MPLRQGFSCQVAHDENADQRKIQFAGKPHRLYQYNGNVRIVRLERPVLCCVDNDRCQIDEQENDQDRQSEDARETA